MEDNSYKLFCGTEDFIIIFMVLNIVLENYLRMFCLWWIRALTFVMRFRLRLLLFNIFFYGIFRLNRHLLLMIFGCYNVANALEQPLLLPQDMADLRSLKKHEVFLTLKRDMAMVSLILYYPCFFLLSVSSISSYSSFLLLLKKAIQATHIAEE